MTLHLHLCDKATDHWTWFFFTCCVDGVTKLKIIYYRIPFFCVHSTLCVWCCMCMCVCVCVCVFCGFNKHLCVLVEDIISPNDSQNFITYKAHIKVECNRFLVRRYLVMRSSGQLRFLWLQFLHLYTLYCRHGYQRHLPTSFWSAWTEERWIRYAVSGRTPPK